MKMSASGVSETLLEVRHLVQSFRVRGRGRVGGGVLHAVCDVSFRLKKGETLGLVGESGSGKTTLARALAQEPPPRSGSVLFLGTDLTRLRGKRLMHHRRELQFVFQDPFGSLNPRWSVSEIVEEPLRGYGIGNRAERQRKVAEVLEKVGLPLAVYGRCRARELSGGQCQRVALARSLAVDPSLIICDEAVSALDVLIQSQLLNLFEQLREDLDLSYLFISHDLAVIRQTSDRVGVMYMGQLCEIGPVESVYERRSHPYTAMLLDCAHASAAQEAAEVLSLPVRNSNADGPSLFEPPTGCRFRFRCPRAQDICACVVPQARAVGEDHLVACHFAESDQAGCNTVYSPERRQVNG